MGLDIGVVKDAARGDAQPAVTKPSAPAPKLESVARRRLPFGRGDANDPEGPLVPPLGLASDVSLSEVPTFSQSISSAPEMLRAAARRSWTRSESFT